MDGAKYKQILQENLFQQNKDPKQRAKTTKKWFGMVWKESLCFAMVVSNPRLKYIWKSVAWLENYSPPVFNFGVGETLCWGMQENAENQNGNRDNSDSWDKSKLLGQFTKYWLWGWILIN